MYCRQYAFSLSDVCRRAMALVRNLGLCIVMLIATSGVTLGFTTTDEFGDSSNQNKFDIGECSFFTPAYLEIENEVTQAKVGFFMLNSDDVGINLSIYQFEKSGADSFDNYDGVTSSAIENHINSCGASKASVTTNIISGQGVANIYSAAEELELVFTYDYGGATWQYRFKAQVPQSSGSDGVPGIQYSLTNNASIPAAHEETSSQTGRLIEQRMAARARRIVGGEDPNMIRNRLTRGGGPGLMAVRGTPDDMFFAFETSAGALGDHYRVRPAADLTGPAGPAGGLDVWAKGTYARAHIDGGKLDVWLAHAGIDYLIDDRFVIGLVGQVDITDENDADDTAFHGTGWLAGPYAAARLLGGLVLDGRVAWGTSDNKITPYGAYTDSFDATRWLARGQLTGDFAFHGLAVNPFVQVVYFSEKQESHTGTLGNDIDERTVALGQLRFAPEVSTRVDAGDGITVMPRASVSGIWDFVQPDVSDVNGVPVADDDLRARFDGGFLVVTDTGLSLDFNGFYDGVGASDIEAYGGSLRLTVPLN